MARKRTQVLKFYHRSYVILSDLCNAINGKNGKTLFKQGSPFSTKAGIHRGPVSRYKLFIEITKYNI